MSQDRLNDLAAMENNIARTIDYEIIVKHFARKKARKVSF